MALGARWKTLGVKFGAVKVKLQGSHNQFCFFRSHVQDFGSHVQDFGSLDWGFEFDSDNYVEGSELSWRPWESSFWAQKGLFWGFGSSG